MTANSSKIHSSVRMYDFSLLQVALNLLLVIAILCGAEVSIPPVISPESQFHFYFTEESFNSAVSDLSKKMSGRGIRLEGTSDSFDSYILQNFSVSPIVLGLFDVAVLNQEAAYDTFGCIKNTSETGKAVEIFFSSVNEANVDLIFNKFTTYGFGGYFKYDFSDFIVLVNGVEQTTKAPSLKSGVAGFIGVLSSLKRIESLRFETSNRGNANAFTMDTTYIVFSDDEIGPPISVYYDFDSWAAATQDLPTFLSMEQEDFAAYETTGFSSSTTQLNHFQMHIPNLTLSMNGILAGIEDYGVNLVIGDLAQDGELQSTRQLGLLLDSIENPYISLTFPETIIAFSGLFFWAFTDAGLQFRVNGQNISFATDHKKPAFLGIVVPLGTKQVDFIVPSGNNSSQTVIVDYLWMASHCCATARCSVEGVEVPLGKIITETPLECLNGYSYRAEVVVCGEGGVADRNPNGTNTLFCPDSAPKCRQCGPVRRGGAICIPDSSTMSNCSFPADYNDTGCLVGENNYVMPVGSQMSSPEFKQCADNSTYFSTTMVCGQNLFPEIAVDKLLCPNEKPICFASGGCCPASGCVTLGNYSGEDKSAAIVLTSTNPTDTSSSNLVLFQIANLQKEKICINITATETPGCHEEFSFDLSKSSNLSLSFEVPANYSLAPDPLDNSIQFKFSADIVKRATTRSLVKARDNLNTNCGTNQVFSAGDGNLNVSISGENCDNLSLSKSSFASISDCGIHSVIKYEGNPDDTNSSSYQENRFSLTESSCRIDNVAIAFTYNTSLVFHGMQSFKESIENGVIGAQLVLFDSNVSFTPPVHTDGIKVSSPVTSIILNPAGIDFEPSSSVSLSSTALFQVVSPLSEKIKCSSAIAENMSSKVVCGAVISFSLDDSSWITFIFAADQSKEMVLEGTADNSIIFEFRATSMVAPDGNLTLNCKKDLQQFSGKAISSIVIGSNTTVALFNPAESSILISACEVNVIAKFTVPSGAKVILQQVSVTALYDRSLVPKGVQSFRYSTDDKMDIRTASFAQIQQESKMLPVCCTEYSVPKPVNMLRGIPRFGFSNDIAYLFSESSYQHKEYTTGLIILPCVLLVILILWLIFIAVLKFLGQKRVGFLSGSNMVEAQYQHLDVHSKNSKRWCKCGPSHIRITFYASAFLLCVGVSIFYALGVRNLHAVTSPIQSAVADFTAMTVDISYPLRELNTTAKDLQAILPLMSSLRLNDLQTAQAAKKLTDFLGNDESLLGAMDLIQSLNSTLFDLSNYLASTSNQMKKAEKNLKLSSIILTQFVTIFTVLLIVSATLAWQERIHPKWLRFHRNVIMPAFTLGIFSCWCFVCALLAAGMLNADACSGGVARSPFGTANETLALMGLEYYQLLAYYASCGALNPFGAWLTQYNNLITAALSAGRPLIDTMTSQNFSESGSDQEAATLFVNIIGNLESALGFISSTASLISCDHISPIYNKAVNQSLCTYCVTSLAWAIWSLLLISFCGMMMITFRAATIPSLDTNNDGDSKCLSSEPKTNFNHTPAKKLIGQEISINRGESLFDDLSLNSDDQSEKTSLNAESIQDHTKSIAANTLERQRFSSDHDGIVDARNSQSIENTPSYAGTMAGNQRFASLASSNTLGVESGHDHDADSFTGSERRGSIRSGGHHQRSGTTRSIAASSIVTNILDDAQSRRSESIQRSDSKRIFPRRLSNIHADGMEVLEENWSKSQN